LSDDFYTVFTFQHNRPFFPTVFYIIIDCPEFDS